MSITSCIYQGWVKHQRMKFKPYKFNYRVFMLLLDLDEIDHLFDRFWFWSKNRFNWAEFREDDYLREIDLGKRNKPNLRSTETRLKTKVRHLLKDAGENYSLGKVGLLTQLRYLGHQMNPVSFFYCYESDTGKLKNIIAEVNNTPWNQQHLYVLRSSDSNDIFEVKQLKKDFHVSPFMPMTMTYRMLFSLPSQNTKVSIQNYQSENLYFKACMNLQRKELNSKNLAIGLAQFPLASVKVFSAIYWQALKLYLRGAKYYPKQEKLKPIFTQNES